MSRGAALLAVAAGLALGCTEDRGGRELDARLHNLRSTRETLHAELEARLQSDPALSAPALTTGNAVIGIERSFLTESITAAAACYLDYVELDLSDAVSIHKEGKISVGVLVGRIPAGDWTVDVDFPRLRGLLRAGEPTIIANADHLDVSIPVRIAGGGAAQVAIRWDPNAVSGLVCGDFRHEIKAAGEVVPRDFMLTGRLVVDFDGGGPVVRSELDDDHIRLHVTLTERSFGRVREVVRKQSEEGGCGLVLDEAKVEARVREFVDRGFRVRLPRQMERSFPLPARFAPAVEVLGQPLAVQIEMSRPTLDATALWSSARVKVSTHAGVSAESPPEPSPHDPSPHDPSPHDPSPHERSPHERSPGSDVPSPIEHDP